MSSVMTELIPVLTHRPRTPARSWNSTPLKHSQPPPTATSDRAITER
jgi:hypothetical protein